MNSMSLRGGGLKYKFLDNFRADLWEKSKISLFLVLVGGKLTVFYQFYLENVNFQPRFANF